MKKTEPISPDLPWAPFQGGELEGVRPGRRCRACREAGVAQSEARQLAICFACYRAELDHDRRLKAAGQIETATEERFQSLEPLAPVNLARLAALRAARAVARVGGSSPWAERRLRAVRAARLALALPAVQPASTAVAAAACVGAAADAARTAVATRKDLPLPAAWLPFVVNVDDAPRQRVG